MHNFFCPLSTVQGQTRTSVARVGLGDFPPVISPPVISPRWSPPGDSPGDSPPVISPPEISPPNPNPNLTLT